MSSPIPIRPATPESLQADLQRLTGLLQQLVDASQPGARLPMWEPPERSPRAVTAPEKYTSTLPTVVLAALRRYSAHRGGLNINVIISEALRSFIPPEHLNAALEELMEEYRRLWTEQATQAERQG